MTERKNNILKKKMTEKLYRTKIYNKAVSIYNNYASKDSKDKEQYENNRTNFLLVLENIVQGIKTLNLQSPVLAEMPVQYKFEGCLLPVTGQIDLADEKQFVEVKTKWRRRTGKYRSDGTMSFSLTAIKPSQEYFLQCIFYHIATGLKINLIIANESEYKIFNQDNCDEFSPENIEKVKNKIRLTCIRRERLAKRHAGKQTWTQDIRLDTSTFYWDRNEHLTIAEELWNTNLI